jgi:tetratricopeptide (TPR) repeat protein
MPSAIIGQYATGRSQFVRAACLILFCLSCVHCVLAAGVRAWRGTITIPTYTLGAPDTNPSFPLVNSNGVYPYTMLDDLRDERHPKTYDALFLENSYLKVIIIPALGGHVYSLYDKMNHCEVLYRNQVVKYGLVGPRGAWIAGGIEFSFPYAHSMNTVSPVESTILRSTDGSASILIGAIDWVSNMYSEVLLTLRPGTARLEENVTLFNSTPQPNLYLFWTNAAVKATNDLQYVYPMREIIDDDPFAIVGSWPTSDGIDKSWYKNDPDAMAIFGRAVHRDYFGVYYHESDRGVIHVADFRQDPGKKIWTWGTARSGRIWDRLLSDEDGPYNEIQSGRFATQGFREFMAPRLIEKWTEYWFPVSGLKDGFVDASNLMAINVTYSADNDPKPAATVRISPVVNATGVTVVIKLGDKALKIVHGVDLVPLHTMAYTEPMQDLQAAKRSLDVEVISPRGETLLHWSASEAPDGNPDFVPHAGTRMESEIQDSVQTPVQALYLRGVFLQKSGNMQGALKVYDEVLQRDPGFISALLRESWYHYQAGEFDRALHDISRAESRDSSNPEARYVSGVIYRAMGRLNAASDALWDSIHYGGPAAPALIELGEIAIRQGSYPEAAKLLKDAIRLNPDDALALADLSVAERLSGHLKDALADAKHANGLMPLLPYALAEQYEDQHALEAESSAPPSAWSDWKKILGSDAENYLAIAAWYHTLGAWQSADLVLKAALEDPSAKPILPMANYYLASDSRRENNLKAAAQYAGASAASKSVAVFPNRLEDCAILQEALQTNPTDPQAKYELGNFLFAHERYEEAASLWSGALRDGFENSVILRNMGEFEWRVAHQLPSAVEDYRRAISLRPSDYRLYSDLDEIYEEEDNMDARSELFTRTPADVLDRDTVRARHVIFLLEKKQFKDALTELANHNFKPWEGGVSFHNLYVTANIQSGRQELASGQPAQAEMYFRNAMQYPENLGTGEPSNPSTAQQLYWLGNALEAENKQEQAHEAWLNAANQGKDSGGSCQVFSATAFQKLGEHNEAREMSQSCRQSAEQPSASAGALFNGGLAEQFSGSMARARDLFRRCLTIDPLYWRARVELLATQ